MKKIYYDKEHEFFLTDEEFKKAFDAWNAKKSFYCLRLGCLLSPFSKVAYTPKEDLGYKVFMYFDKQINVWCRIWWHNGKYYDYVSDTATHCERYFSSEEAKKEFEKNIIPQEEYYKNIYG